MNRIVNGAADIPHDWWYSYDINVITGNANASFPSFVIPKRGEHTTLFQYVIHIKSGTETPTTITPWLRNFIAVMGNEGIHRHSSLDGENLVRNIQ